MENNPQQKEATQPELAPSSENNVIVAPEQNNARMSYFNIQAWKAMREMAVVFHKSGAIPTYIRNPEQLIVILQTGKEMGMYPMESINNLYIIGGRVAMQSQAMLSRMIRAGVTLEWLEESENRAEVKLDGLAGRKPYTSSFTREEANKAGLIKNGGAWVTYPKQMLRWRALAFGARIYCPEVLQGMHTVEEMGNVTLSDQSGVFKAVTKEGEKKDEPKIEPEKPAETQKPVEGEIVDEAPSRQNDAPVAPHVPDSPTSQPASKNEIGLFLTLMRQKEGVGVDDMESILGYLSLIKGVEVEKIEDMSRDEIKRVTADLMKKQTMRPEEAE